MKDMFKIETFTVLMLLDKGRALCEIDFSEPRHGIFFVYSTVSSRDGGYAEPKGGRVAFGLAEIIENQGRDRSLHIGEERMVAFQIISATTDPFRAQFRDSGPIQHP